MRFTPRGRRSLRSSPLQYLWIEIAASCAWLTAQMMFSGPQAASPPKNTPSREHMNVVRSTSGQSHSLNSMPMSRSIHGNALSWPIARMTSSQGMVTSPTDLPRSMRPFSSMLYSIWSNFMPTSLPSSTTNSFGEWLTTISTFSSSASSSSQSEALKKPRGLRAMTLTSFAPSLSEVRQQSIAVLPTPMISTFSPIDSVCSKATDSSQSMPMWTLAVSCRPGSSSSLPRGAPVPTKIASKPPLSSRSCMLSMRWPSFRSAPISMM